MGKLKQSNAGLFRRGVQFVVKHIFGTIITLGTVALIGLIGTNLWSLPKPITLDFQTEHRCLNGKLTNIRKRIPDLRGADGLTICDTETLVVVPSEVPREVALRYKGCLTLVNRKLTILRASDAVCALPNEAGYICDGTNPKARKNPGSGAIGIGQKVSLCSTELLTRFGFAS